MLRKTNTEFAPWHILESNDKKYARIKALRIVVDAIKEAHCRKEYVPIETWDFVEVS